MSDFTSWLKSAQNGSIGEIRTKAFLLDRFWVLERSVDIDSVDFLIQRRLPGKQILDQSPPRFGVVQAKFSQNEKTTHCLRKQDILDKDGRPHIEFFLIIHTGDEESQRMFLLTATDIADDFAQTEDSKFDVSSRAVFESPKYLVANRKHGLDRIENSIQCAEFYKNRVFVFSRLDESSSLDFEAILPVYKEEISDYFHEDIPYRFEELKKEAFDAMLRIEKAHALLKLFVESVDPLEAIVVAETLDNQVERIDLTEIFIADLYHDSKRFKEKIQNLRSDGLLDNFITSRKDLIAAINCFLGSYPTDQLCKKSIHEIAVDYDPVGLKFIGATHKIWKPGEQQYSDFDQILEAKDGKIVLSWKIGLQLTHSGRLKLNDCCAHEIINKMYGLKYFEGEEVIKPSVRTSPGTENEGRA